MDDTPPVTRPKNRYFIILAVVLTATGIILLSVFLIGIIFKSPEVSSADTWTLVSYADETGILVPVITNANITARFERDGNMTGFSGCNMYMAAYLVNGNRMAITPPLATKTSCNGNGVMAQEKAFFSNLPRTAFIDKSPGQIRILDTNKKTLMIFRSS